MPTFDAYFEIKVNQLIASAGGNKIFFFKGFGYPQIKHLVNHPNSILVDSTLLGEGIIDVTVIYEKWFDILAAIKKANKPLVGFYEELLAVRDYIPRISSSEIVIVENNMLSPWSPSCLPYEQALELFDYYQGDYQPSTKLELLTTFYGEVKLIDNDTQKVLLLSPPIDGRNIVLEPFWTASPVKCEIDADERIEITSQRDWEYRLDLLYGRKKPVILLQSSSIPEKQYDGLLSALTSLGIPFACDELELYIEKVAYSDKPFLPLLRKHWGLNASFRPLMFYKDPDLSREIEEISQGQIVAEIVDQCEQAAINEPFSNIFITAPTGSGKSILFQLPALYLAEKYGCVTIVVTPLISLMNDQVEQLESERKISIAACINSTITIDERINITNQIRSGKKSLIYLAPELLLTTNLQAFLGGRRLGLVVIDEAHTVISWGSEFRSDYWFLGDFLRQSRRNGLVFPVLCLTATAVYSGRDDVVNKTIQELGLERTIVHLGRVRRENIGFDIICHSSEKIVGKLDSVKQQLTLEKVRAYIANREKVLVYFPYRRQVDDIHSLIPLSEKTTIRRYHGKLKAEERKLALQSYKSGEAMGLFGTKAFGMGVDVGDIKHVMHFAPTGSLADYIQEIGRAARKLSMQGIAHIDFFPGDLSYVRKLYGMSEMRHYQLREMLKKISSIYEAKKRRNLLISAETFEYLFSERDVANCTKTGLMLLAKDLHNKYAFPVLVVRPKPMLSKNYVNVPCEIEQQFLTEYGDFAEVAQGSSERIIPSNNARNSAITAYSAGRIYKVDMAKVWESCYPDRSFGVFKKEFFSKAIIVNGQEYHYSPRVRVELRYIDDFDVVMNDVRTLMDIIVNFFSVQKNRDTKQFTLRQFEQALSSALGDKMIAHDKVPLLLGIFTHTVDENAAFTSTRSQVQVLMKRKAQRSEETEYFVNNGAYARLSSYFCRSLAQCRPTKSENNAQVYHRFYPLTENSSIEIMPLLRLLELLELANYEIRGGEKAEVFIRINDPDKIKLLASINYHNTVLHEIHNRHQHNLRLLNAFFMSKMSTEDRWDLIEQYFLGNETAVHERLGLQE